MLWGANTNLVGFREEARGQHRVFWGFQAVGGALWHDNVHGYVTHCVEFLYREDINLWSAGWYLGWQSSEQICTVHILYIQCSLRCNVYLIGFGIAGGLSIFCLFDIFHHFPYEGVAVVLILGHDNLKDKPQSPNKEGKFDISIPDFEF